MGMMLFGLQEAVRTVQLGVVVFLFIFSRIFLLHWRQPVFGVAFGLGILPPPKYSQLHRGWALRRCR